MMPEAAGARPETWGEPRRAAAEPARAVQGGRLLVVDDNEMNRDLLSRRLERQGHRVDTAAGGEEALAALEREPYDLVLLDVMMPGLDGPQVLERLKRHERLRHVPVIMISALGELDTVVRCIEAGAEDYLPKPFDPVLLRARIEACLGKKRAHDREEACLQQLVEARQRSEALLRNVLPGAIADRLEDGERCIVDRFPDVTVLFLDLVAFSRLAASRPPGRVVEILNDLFSAFDVLADRHGAEKIKTIGDAYMVATGLPAPRPDHALVSVALALALRREVADYAARSGEPLACRIGLHAGPVVAGVIGTRRFCYDLWGETVNLASRMESQGQPGRIQVTAAFRERLGGAFRTEPRGTVDVKGHGPMEVWYLEG
jgi:class 3 adenylate cyclase